MKIFQQLGLLLWSTLNLCSSWWLKSIGKLWMSQLRQLSLSLCWTEELLAQSSYPLCTSNGISLCSMLGFPQPKMLSNLPCRLSDFKINNYHISSNRINKGVGELGQSLIEPFLLSKIVLMSEYVWNELFCLKGSSVFEDVEKGWMFWDWYLDGFWRRRSAMWEDWTGKWVWFLVGRNQCFSWLRSWCCKNRGSQGLEVRR